MEKEHPRNQCPTEHILRTRTNTDTYSNCWHLKLGLVNLGASFLSLKGKLVLAVVFCTYCLFPTPVIWRCSDLHRSGSFFFNLLSLETYCILFSILVSFVYPIYIYIALPGQNTNVPSIICVCVMVLFLHSRKLSKG